MSPKTGKFGQVHGADLSVMTERFRGGGTALVRETQARNAGLSWPLWLSRVRRYGRCRGRSPLLTYREITQGLRGIILS